MFMHLLFTTAIQPRVYVGVSVVHYEAMQH